MKTISIQCVGYSISANLYENNEEKVLLVLSGWGSNKKQQEPMSQYLAETTDTTVLAIDYSGHGESPFNAMDVRPAQHFLEVITAFDWIRQNYPNAKVSVLGTSYGAYLAVQLTKYREFDNLILRVPAIYAPEDFYSLNKNIARQSERKYREDKEFLDSHPLLARASRFKGRTLVVWHENDEYIPKETVDKFIEVFNADSYLAKGWQHKFKVDAPDEEKIAYQNAISDWLLKD